MLQSGVYKLLNKSNKHFYVGSTIDFNKRHGEHINALRSRYHRNRYLQHAYDKYGEANFDFIILARCPLEYVLKLEQWFLNALKPEYNIRKVVVDSNVGISPTQQTRAKMSKAAYRNKNALGAIRTDEQRKAISKTLVGHEINARTRNKISQALTGQVQSKETIEKRVRKLYKKVRYIDNHISIEYESIKQAASKQNISTTHIILCCQGKKKSSKGKWEYV